MTARYMDIADLYDRALQAEPELTFIETMVETMCALAPSERSGKPFCAGCIWENILKPLATWWIGECRQYLPKTRPDEYTTGLVSKASDTGMPRLRPGGSEIEEWLRSAEAWDTVTDRWLAWLEDADPGNGCGLPRVRHDQMAAAGTK